MKRGTADQEQGSGLILDIESSWERAGIAAVVLFGAAVAIWLVAWAGGNADMLPWWPGSLFLWILLLVAAIFFRRSLNDFYVLDSHHGVLEWRTQRLSRRVEKIATFAEILGVCLQNSTSWDNGDPEKIDAAVFLYLRNNTFLRVSAWKNADFSGTKKVSLPQLNSLAKRIAGIVGCPFWDHDFAQIPVLKTGREIWAACQDAVDHSGFSVPAEGYWEWALTRLGLESDGPGTLVFRHYGDFFPLFFFSFFPLWMIGGTWFGSGKTSAGLTIIFLILTSLTFAGWVICLDWFLLRIFPVATRFDLSRNEITQSRWCFGLRYGETVCPIDQRLSLGLSPSPPEKSTRTWSLVFLPEEKGLSAITSLIREKQASAGAVGATAEKLGGLLELPIKPLPENGQTFLSMAFQMIFTIGIFYAVWLAGWYILLWKKG